jgi:hypothetical protein
MSLLTNARRYTLAKWNVCVVWSSPFVSLREAVWIEILRRFMVEG